MNCRAAEKAISALVDGELNGAEALELRQHLAQCSSCAAVLDAEKRLKNRLSAMPMPELSADFESRLQLAVFGTPQPRRRWAWGSVAVAAAACALAFYAVQGRRASQPASVASAEMNPSSVNKATIQAADSFGGSAPVMLVSTNGR